MPGGVKAHPVPFEIKHLAGHGDLPFRGLERRGVDEFGHHFARAGGQIKMERVHIDQVTVPGNKLAADKEPDIGQSLHGAARAMVTGHPFGQLQDEAGGSGRHRNGLGHPPHGALGIARVDDQRDRAAGIGRIGWRRHRRRDRHGGRRGPGLGHSGRGQGKNGGKRDTGAGQGSDHAHFMPRSWVARNRGHTCGWGEVFGAGASYVPFRAKSL